MLKIYTKAKALLATRDQGVTAAEYGLILALIAGVIILTVGLLGQKILNAFDTVETNMP